MPSPFPGMDPYVENPRIWPNVHNSLIAGIRDRFGAGDDDAKLNLQEIFASVYDRAGFDLILNYREAPDPPLDDKQAAWVDQWLKKKGLR